MSQLPLSPPELERMRTAEVAAGRIADELRYARYHSFEDTIATELDGMYGHTRFGQSLLHHVQTIAIPIIEHYAPNHALKLLSRDDTRLPLYLGGLLALQVETERDTETVKGHIQDSRVPQPLPVWCDALKPPLAAVVHYMHQRDREYMNLPAALQQAVANAAKAAIHGSGGDTRGFSERQFRQGYALVHTQVGGIRDAVRRPAFLSMEGPSEA